MSDESRKHTNAGVAQQVEQLICNQQVAGSIPVTSSKYSNLPGLSLEAV